mgnify:CR=1 FL=1
MRCDFQTNSLEELIYYSVLFTDGDYDRNALNLFHYTAAENEDKIIKGDCLKLRFTRADQFQDKNEGRHVISVLRELLKECKNYSQIDEDFYLNTLSIIQDSEDISNELRNLYVFCFSKNGNSDFLRRNYACKGNTTNGIMIGITALSLEDLSDGNAETEKKWYTRTAAPIFIKDVLYNQEDLKEYIKCLLLTVYELRNQDDDQHRSLRKIVRGLLYSYGLVYKNTEYRNEEETRIIVDTSEIDFCIDIFSKDRDESTNERYIYLNLPKNALYCVKKVIPCPTSPVS